MKRNLKRAFPIVITIVMMTLSLVPYQPVQADHPMAIAVAKKQVSYNGFSLTYDTSLGANVVGRTVSRENEGYFGPESPYGRWPQHTEFTFPGLGGVASVHIFPLPEYQNMVPEIGENIDTLRYALSNRPDIRSYFSRGSRHALPIIPMENAGPLIISKLAYVDFQSGSGIRYVTMLGQDLAPIYNDSLVYMFQGLSNDGKYVISAQFSVTGPLDRILSDDPQDIEDYNRRMEARLDQIPNNSYGPDISLLDEVIRSLNTSSTGSPPPNVPGGTSYNFPQTGFSASGRIWDTWQSGRSFEVSVYINGYPITSLRAEVSLTDGKTYQTQWFERARFEQHPENQAPYDVLLGLLGASAAKGRQNEAAFKPVGNPGGEVPWFKDTSHTLGDTSEGGRAIAAYWNNLGGLPQFGYPLSQPFTERSKDDGKTYLVQYFERQRFEYHPENKGTRYEVLLGRLGAEQAEGIGTLLRTLTGHTDKVYCVAFSPDGQTIASGSQETSVRLWRASEGTLLHTITGHSNIVTAVAFSPDGKLLASGSPDFTVRIWRVADGVLVRTLNHSLYVYSLAFSHDGQILVSGSGGPTSEGKVQLWRVTDGTLLRTFVHTGLVGTVAISPDGQIVASTSGSVTEAIAIRLWRVSDGALLRTVSGSGGKIGFSPDGQTLAAGGTNNTAQLWRVSDGALVRSFTGGSNSVVLSPDGQLIAAVTEDNSIQVWRVSDGVPLRRLSGHTDTVTELAFGPDSQSLVSSSYDRTIKLWKVR